MTDRAARQFAFADFECSISTPWSGDEIELSFDDRHREAWRDLPISELEFREDDGEGDPDEDTTVTSPCLDAMDVALGKVSAERCFADGVAHTFAHFALELHLEPGPWGEIRQRKVGRGTTLWSPRLEGLFVRLVSSLCEAKPPALVKLPPPEPRRCTAAELVREGWATGGAEVSCRDLDDFWNPGTPIDVPRLLAAIERGETHRRASPDVAPDARIDAQWRALRDRDGSVRLVTPLAMETIRVEVLGHERPGFLSARYFLAIDLDARGEVEAVSIRAARSGTFDAETDDGPSIFAERDPTDDRERLGDKLSELAYTAVSWVLEDHLREDDDVVAADA